MKDVINHPWQDARSNAALGWRDSYKPCSISRDFIKDETWRDVPEDQQVLRPHVSLPFSLKPIATDGVVCLCLKPDGSELLVQLKNLAPLKRPPVVRFKQTKEQKVKKKKTLIVSIELDDLL